VYTYNQKIGKSNTQCNLKVIGGKYTKG